MKPPSKEADLLFEQHSIAEIIDIEKKLKANIEKKKEDLRQMVGERYRDLLEAADTITEMKNTALKIVQQTSDLKMLSSKIHSLDTASLTDYKFDPKRNETIELAKQVKYIVDSPTKLWGYTDEGQYLAAILTYLTARQLHIALYLKPAVYSRFPILAAQWTAVSNILPKVVHASKVSLESEVLKYQEACDTLSGLLLLEKGSVSSSFQDFLAIRKKSAIKILDAEKPGVTVKGQLCQLLQLILNTITILDKIFAPPCLLVSDLNTILSNNKETFLPKQDLSLHNPLSLEELHHSSLQFLNELSELCMPKISELLHFMTTAKTLALLREAILDVLTQGGNDKSTELYHWLISQANVDFWHLCLHLPFVDRIKTLIDSHLDQTLSNLKNTIDRSSRQNSDIAEYIWAAGDVCKIAGYPPNIQQICEDLEADLKGLLDDLDSLPPLFMQDITDHLCDKCKHFINSLVEHMNHQQDPEWALFIYRFSLALSHLTPSLFFSHFHKVDDITPLNTVADKFFKIWSDDLLSRLMSQLENDIGNSEPSSILSKLQTWEKIEIQEENEEGKQIKSTIHVPFQISMSLHTLLFRVVSEINAAGGYTFPRKAVNSIGQELAVRLSKAYTLPQSSWPSNPHLAETLALQLWFDIRYLVQLLGTNSATFAPLLADIESHIDPFDMDVFTTPLQANLRQALHRSSILFGLLASPTLPARSTTSGQEVHNLIPLPSQPASKFPLLPSPPSHLTPKDKPLTGGLRSHSSSPNLTSSSSPSKLTASLNLDSTSTSSPIKSSTSFYDRMTSAMSTSWFS